MRVSQFIIASMMWSVLVWAALEVTILLVTIITWDLHFYDSVGKHLALYKGCIPLGFAMHWWLRE